MYSYIKAYRISQEKLDEYRSLHMNAHITDHEYLEGLYEMGFPGMKCFMFKNICFAYTQSEVSLEDRTKLSGNPKTVAWNEKTECMYAEKDKTGKRKSVRLEKIFDLQQQLSGKLLEL